MLSWTDHIVGRCGQSGTGMHCGEEFVPENMMSWELNIAPGTYVVCLPGFSRTKSRLSMP